jgi:hypothetical protein
MASDTVAKVKVDLRISHAVLDTDIKDTIDACLQDLKTFGIKNDIADPLILRAVKLYCRSVYEEDPAKAAAYETRYNDMRASLQMAEGYGYNVEAGADE